MRVKCLIFGHKWEGCKCQICRSTRDTEHSWAGCKCQICGTTRDTEHSWTGCKCQICGTTRDEEHDWTEFCGQCRICGKTRYFVHTWDGCVCTTCGMKRDSDHKWEGNTCIVCGVKNPNPVPRKKKVDLVQSIDFLDAFVRVEDGSFIMGSKIFKDSDDKFTRTPHEVNLSAFLISRFQVTQNKWREVMGDNPSHFVSDFRPVESVSWYDCIVFCNKLSEKYGFESCYHINDSLEDINNHCVDDPHKWTVLCDYGKNGFRLPTEAEWEFAARGGNASKNYTFSGSNDIDKVAIYTYSDFGSIGSVSLLQTIYAYDAQTLPVGKMKPNELGLYDMSGNVNEWCWDWIDTYIYKGYVMIDDKFYQNSPHDNPTGLSYGKTRAIRGGSWTDVEYVCGVSTRGTHSPYIRSNYIGIRLARSC